LIASLFMETAAEWLIDQFEATLEEYRSGEVHWAQLGLGVVQDMIMLKDDLELHSYPRCATCGWIGEGPEPAVRHVFFETLMFPVYGDYGPFRVMRVQPRRYLQAGLPPV
jgi:hypothetical protein